MSPHAPPRAILRVLSDERLAGHAAEGSQAAFTVLYDRHATELLAACRSVVRDDDDARDALQSAMLSAWRAIGRRGEAPVRPWLFRIARNEAISVLRRRRPAAELSDALGAGTDVHATAAGRFELARLLGDLETLPRRQREALLLRTLGDTGYDEIARRQETSRQAVRQSVATARRTLRRGRLAGIVPLPAWVAEFIAAAGTTGAPALQAGVAKTAVGVTAAVAVVGGTVASGPPAGAPADHRPAVARSAPPAASPPARAVTRPVAAPASGAVAAAPARGPVPAAGRATPPRLRPVSTEPVRHETPPPATREAPEHPAARREPARRPPAERPRRREHDAWAFDAAPPRRHPSRSDDRRVRPEPTVDPAPAPVPPGTVPEPDAVPEPGGDPPDAQPADGEPEPAPFDGSGDAQ
jgi:RNA polymerase sigma factor (sigma-70 family)